MKKTANFVAAALIVVGLLLIQNKNYQSNEQGSTEPEPTANVLSGPTDPRDCTPGELFYNTKEQKLKICAGNDGIRWEPTFCTVRVCGGKHAPHGKPCLPLASIYVDKEMLIPKANPFVTLPNGEYSFVSPAGEYSVQLSCPREE